MTQDIGKIAIQAVQALRCAQDTIDALQMQLNKRAALLERPAQPLVCQVVAKLVKLGKLAQCQASSAAQLICSDTNAALRCIRQLLTDQPYTKTASDASQDQLSVGKLVSTSNRAASIMVAEDGREAALKILKTEL